MKIKPLFHKNVGKKGTEKPIEIFVALFVILAVALVMLKLFQNQITQKQTELQTAQEEGKQKELMQKAVAQCQDKCLQASNTDCSIQSLASLCLSYGSDALGSMEYLDLNSNGKKDVDNTLIPGIGVCEDKVPCHALISSCCSTQISALGCKKILEDFWKDRGFTPKNINCSIKSLVKWTDGACQTPDTSAMTWYTQSTPETKSYMSAIC
jgi:hypothetical protein